ncbi:sodium/glutamate symporter [Kamptonema cortianum]|uniref:Sodium/glutamate symporter n=1 Tax=Geitlerinema calcuttense NRMC-F 0142 TaxID=2922238 RepID=A0ABT7LVA0_9CYAN|nr:sodium/glutamate symporter [Geitlerinema calcuttense]MDK3159727.1 sodium/glutamate symporter [Kamptonema cortianum]MDL5055972.1 sodium/glutamate symporter [Geitlerinema calcuttense NRMC-F 0142]
MLELLELIDVLFAFILVALLLLLGRLVKQKVPLFQKLYLPESIIAGFIALILGPGVVGAIARTVGGDETFLATGLFPEATRTVWSQSPGVFINIVFAALFIGETIPHPRDIWRKAAPQVAFGQSLAWGQYVVGLLLALLVLVPLFQVDPIAGALIEIAFEGGHGTAAGMGDTFRELGFEAGPDLALGLATVGIVSGVVSGIILADWGRRKGYVQTVSVEPTDPALYEERHVEDRDTRLARMRLMENLLIDPLSLNFGFVGAAIVIGWLILQVLRFIESVTWGAAGFELIRYVPLFPMALIGGLVVQLVMERLGLAPLIIRRLQERIAGVALDVVVVTALASINLTILGANLGVFLTLSLAGIIWNVWAFLYLGPRLLPTYWFERGIGDLGQSMGVTATGILLIRMVDPDNRTGAFESFAYKQLFFEPIVGGGLFTAAAPPLIRQFGPIPILILTTLLLAFWIGFGLLNYKRIALRSEQQAVEQENTLSR